MEAWVGSTAFHICHRVCSARLAPSLHLLHLIPIHKVCRWIEEGVHLKAGDEVYISWGRRLLNDPGLLYCSSQILLLHLLADYPPKEAEKLLKIVEGMGGVRRLFLRFFRHYDVRWASFEQRPPI